MIQRRTDPISFGRIRGFAAPFLAALIVTPIVTAGCGSISACPPHDLDVTTFVSPLPGEAAPGPTLRLRQPGDTWTYAIRRNQWENGALFALDGTSIESVEPEPVIDPTGIATTAVRSETTFSTCDGAFAYTSIDRDYLSQDETGRSSLHGFRFEDDTTDETSFIIKPAGGYVTAIPELVIGSSVTIDYLYDNGLSIESTRNVDGVDLVRVQAGEFVAFRVRGTQHSQDAEGETVSIVTNWIVPDLAVAALSYNTRQTLRTDGTVAVVEEIWELASVTVADLGGTGIVSTQTEPRP